MSDCRRRSPSSSARSRRSSSIRTCRSRRRSCSSRWSRCSRCLSWPRSVWSRMRSSSPPLSRRRSSSSSTAARIDRRPLILVAILLGLYVINVGSGHGVAWAQGVRLTGEPLVLLLVGLILPEPRRTFRWALGALIGTACLVAGYGIVQQIVGKYTLVDWGYSFEDQVRSLPQRPAAELRNVRRPVRLRGLPALRAWRGLLLAPSRAARLGGRGPDPRRDPVLVQPDRRPDPRRVHRPGAVASPASGDGDDGRRRDRPDRGADPRQCRRHPIEDGDRWPATPTTPSPRT